MDNNEKLRLVALEQAYNAVVDALQTKAEFQPCQNGWETFENAYIEADMRFQKILGILMKGD